MARIKGTKKDDKLKGFATKDKILALAGDDKVQGLGGKDLLDGGDGDDLLSGGRGIDTLKAASGDDTMKGGKGNDFLDGGIGNDRIKGGVGDDRIDGGEGDDAVFGGAGDDFIVAGPGKDGFDGGVGFDTVDYSASAAFVHIDLLNAKTGADGDTLTSIEHIIGTNFSDFIAGNDTGEHLEGRAGTDTLLGWGGNDTLDGGDGDDYLHGGAGADTFIGGDGSDTVSYAFETKAMFVNLQLNESGGSAEGDSFAGIENVWGTAAADVLAGDDGENFLVGGAGSDSMDGKGGNDVMRAGEGFDIVNAGDGNDRVFAGESKASGDNLIGGKGIDWLDYADAGGHVTVSLAINAGAFHALNDEIFGFEHLSGSRYDDTLQAGKNGRVYGNDGDDFIFDTTGTEVLRGGKGADILADGVNGEDGRTDIFFLEKGMGSDTVMGFSQGADVFWLSTEQFGDLDFDTNGILANGQVLNSTVPKATIGGAQLIFDTDDNKLYYDQDGTGGKSAIEIATISNFSGNLTKSDFLVVPDI